MKKYLTVVLAFTIMTTTHSAVNAELSPKCIHTFNAAAEKLEHKSLQEVLKDGLWDKFKADARAKGLWKGIVSACCSPLPGYKCKGCQCGQNDDCTSHCLCCWGEEQCSVSSAQSVSEH